MVHPDDLFCPAASGSAAPDAMIVVPCSMGSLARVACGISGNLIERAADVMIKERRPLLLVPRETPLSTIHLENMLRLSRSGVQIIPAMPAFYQHPRFRHRHGRFCGGQDPGPAGNRARAVPQMGRRSLMLE